MSHKDRAIRATARRRARRRAAEVPQERRLWCEACAGEGHLDIVDSGPDYTGRLAPRSWIGTCPDCNGEGTVVSECYSDHPRIVQETAKT